MRAIFDGQALPPQPVRSELAIFDERCHLSRRHAAKTYYPEPSLRENSAPTLWVWHGVLMVAPNAPRQQRRTTLTLSLYFGWHGVLKSSRSLNEQNIEFFDDSFWWRQEKSRDLEHRSLAHDRQTLRWRNSKEEGELGEKKNHSEIAHISLGGAPLRLEHLVVASLDSAQVACRGVFGAGDMVSTMCRRFFELQTCGSGRQTWRAGEATTAKGNKAMDIGFFALETLARRCTAALPPSKLTTAEASSSTNVSSPSSFRFRH